MLKVNLSDSCTLFLFLLLIGTGCTNEQKGTAELVGKEAKVYVTTLDKSQRLQEHPAVKDPSLAVDETITINPDSSYQEIDGFGFTLTGGSALHLSKMPASARAAILQELFGKQPGNISVNYLRLSLGGSDLDEKPWSYNDLPKGATDTSLDKFSLAYDTLYLIPLLKEILRIAPNIKLMASPWSPPAWMKDNQDTRGGSLLPKYYDVYARYLARYIKEMAKQGIRIDALTIQNEPLHPGNNPSLLMLADQQADFIKQSLGPVFSKQAIDTKIIIYDHNADRPDYPISILNDQEAASYIDGSAFHLYGGSIDALSGVHRAHPSKNIYFTEQWIGEPGNFAEDVEWHIENLIIGATRNWSRTVLEWNLAADENQQPHTDRGGCDRCLGALTITGDEVIRNPAYYIIAHASRFIPAGSYRIDSSPTSLPNVAFKTPDGKIVSILLNKDDSARVVEIISGEDSLHVKLPGKSVGTLVYPNVAALKSKAVLHYIE